MKKLKKYIGFINENDFDHEMDVEYSKMTTQKSQHEQVISKKIEILNNIKEVTKSNNVAEFEKLVKELGIDYDNYVLVRLALKFGNVELIKVLEKAGFTFKHPRDLYACFAADGNKKENIEYLFEKGYVGNVDNIIKWVSFTGDRNPNYKEMLEFLNNLKEDRSLNEESYLDHEGKETNFNGGESVKVKRDDGTYYYGGDPGAAKVDRVEVQNVDGKRISKVLVKFTDKDGNKSSGRFPLDRVELI